MVGRLTGYTPRQAERMPDMGIKDPKRIYTAEELAPGKNIVFAATGVTDGPLLKGVRFFGDGVRTSSLVMKMQNRKVRFIESIPHVSRTLTRRCASRRLTRLPAIPGSSEWRASLAFPSRNSQPPFSPISCLTDRQQEYTLLRTT